MFFFLVQVGHTDGMTSAARDQPGLGWGPALTRTDEKTGSALLAPL